MLLKLNFHFFDHLFFHHFYINHSYHISSHNFELVYDRNHLLSLEYCALKAHD